MIRRDLAPLRVLVMGLPNSGKTHLATRLARALGTRSINADKVRAEADDWDFSVEGRLRQARRMREQCDAVGGVVVADFVCPTEETRAIFEPHYVIHMDSEQSPYPDTDAIFERPRWADMAIGYRASDVEIVEHIAPTVLRTLPQGFVIGRFQPWHIGHQMIAEEAMRRHGLVTIYVRATPRSESNPFDVHGVFQRIRLLMEKRGVPESAYQLRAGVNVAGVYYGRDVGYAIEQIHLPAEVEAVRATDIRESIKNTTEVRV